MNKKIIFALSLLVFFIFLTEVSAFGVVSHYFEGNDFVIAPGEVKTAELVLQNMVGEEDIRIKVKMGNGQGIASVTEQIYLVRAQTSDTSVPITIKIPKDTSIGTKYKVVVEFETVTVGTGGGAVSFGVGIQTAIPVLVVSEEQSPKEAVEKKEIPYIIIIILAVLILLAAIIIWLIKRHRKN